jgi:hypothetical protein
MHNGIKNFKIWYVYDMVYIIERYGMCMQWYQHISHGL